MQFKKDEAKSGTNPNEWKLQNWRNEDLKIGAGCGNFSDWHKALAA
jgi:hypothetical protein